MTKKILLILTVLFFAGMLFLTLFAEQMHNASLPKVTVSHPEQKPFHYEYTDENGKPQTGYAQKLAVPETMPKNGVYILYYAEKNGTKRSFVRKAPVQTGEEQDGYVEIVSGLMFSDRIVVESTETLYDGCEVTVK